MTEEDFFSAMNAAVVRWQRDHVGERLRSLPFAAAEPANCHGNAEVFVTKYGGEVVRGFLVLHPHNWPKVRVMPHSVVRTSNGLVDVTLTEDQLRGHAFFSIDGDVDGFKDWAKRFPQRDRPIMGAAL